MYPTSIFYSIFRMYGMHFLWCKIWFWPSAQTLNYQINVEPRLLSLQICCYFNVLNLWYQNDFHIRCKYRISTKINPFENKHHPKIWTRFFSVLGFYLPSCNSFILKASFWYFSTFTATFWLASTFVPKRQKRK